MLTISYMYAGMFNRLRVMATEKHTSVKRKLSQQRASVAVCVCVCVLCFSLLCMSVDVDISL